ncbi:quinolinate synthase NadA [Corynebacterium accolens]|uniref:quinolinate synthase NadA n=1 Tax=Corynebacterium accolens TaxID=38284 RepID=UPI001EDAA467|nr:quinolinate synthase NadA [Corynebacterium accolens]
MPSATYAGSDPEAPKAWAERIKELAEQRNAVILAHNYQIPEIQDVAHHTGDSLALSRKAAETDADIIVFCGVHFMAESAKILSPNKKVLIPDERAGCSLADSITADELRAWKSEHPDALVVSYVNTTAEVKALTDVCCTSSNAVDVVNSLPADKEILFCPDQFLGAYVKRETGRENIRIWAGECHVHAGISAQQLTQQTQDNPDADLYIHPECGCSNSALYLANEGLVPQERVHMLSTGQMITQSQKQPQNKVLVATETGMLHQLRQAAPDIDFQAVNDHAECKYMKMITPEALERCLVEETDEVTVPEDIANAARKSLEAMISIGNPGGGE